MVRRRRDELHPGRGIPQPRNSLVYLVAGKLPALARLGTLRHLDLQFLGMNQVVCRDPEARRGHLLDGTVLGIAVWKRHEPFRVLAALSGVALGTQPVHSDGQGLVGFFADRAEGHGASRKPFDDLLRWLDFLQRDGLRQGLELQESSDVRPALALVVHQRGELFIGLGVIRLGRVLEPVNRLRVPVVVLTLNSIVDFSAKVELPDRRRMISQGMPAQRFLADLSDSDAFDS